MKSEYLSKRGKWLYPLAGAVLGALYVLLDEGVLDQIPSESSLFVAAAHEFLDAVLPVLLGLSLGAGAYLLRRQRKLTQKLSVKNEALQNDILFHTLISQMLHEIRNPVHTIRAALENSDALSAAEQKELILRNLDRFGELKKLYEEKESLFDRLNPRESLKLDGWLNDLIKDKIKTQLKELRVQFSKNTVPAEIRMHPLLFEQVLLTLFSNAIEAASKAPAGSGWIGLDIRPAEGAPDKIEIRLANTGALFPDEVLASQGNRPAKSEKGHGLGLLLTKKLLDQAGGSLSIGNREGKAEARVLIPGKQL